MARPLILAHRGDWTRAAENSLDAFSAAAARPGVDGVEFDVRAARDGTPVVIHDVNLLRVQGVAGRVSRLTALTSRSTSRLSSAGSCLEKGPASPIAALLTSTST